MRGGNKPGKTLTPVGPPLVELLPRSKDEPRPELGAARFWGMATLLVLLCAVTYWPILDNGFVDIDDEDGFVKNRHLLEPTGELIRWASTSYLQGVYQPLARIMYGLEASLWGVTPGGFHGVSVALQAANAVALLALTISLIRLARPSSIAEKPWLVLGMATLSVGLFVAHPLRAEVVAWASVQAYLPSSIFAILCVLAYLRRDGAAGVWKFGWFAVSVVFFGLSLGFYAITLCLPLALLVLDVYPLRRLAISRASSRQAVGIFAEKTPYFALSLAFAFLTFQARSGMGTVAPLAQDGPGQKLAASCYSSCFYLVKTLIPIGLGPIHPVPDRISMIEPAFALSILAFISICFVAYRFRRTRPAIGAVWVGYLLLQLPTSGLVRFASTIAADRYSAITMLGLPALVASGLCLLATRQPRRATLSTLGLGGALALIVLVGLSREECRTWHDSVSIWSHVAESHDRPEGFFESRIGRALADVGRLDEAEQHLETAVQLSPGLGYAHGKLGLVLVAKGRIREAYQQFAEAVRLEPNHVEARLNLAFALVQLGQPSQAEVQLTEAVRLAPELADARANLGAVLVQLGRPAEAEIQLAEALRLAPDRPNARMDLGYALATQRKFSEAAEQYAEQVRLQPDDVNARSNLALILGQLGRPDEARRQATEARRIAAENAAARLR